MMQIRTSTSIVVIALVMAVCACTQFQRSYGDLTGNKYAKIKSGLWWTDKIPRFKPVKGEDKTAWISFRNVTQESFDLESKLEKAVRDRGYTVTDDPQEATFHIFYTMRFFGENDFCDEGITKVKRVHGGRRSRRLEEENYSQPQSMHSKVREYDMILDVDIAQWKENTVSRSYDDNSISTQKETSVHANPEAVFSGNVKVKREEGQSYGEEDHFYWYVNSLVLWAKQIGLTTDEATACIGGTLQKALPQFLP